MRIEPENGIVTMMRGDSLVLPVYINDGTKLAPKLRSLRDTETLFFGLMEPGKAFEDAVLKKVLGSEDKTDKDGNPLILIAPSDTEKLLVGKYYYMIKLREIDENGSSQVKTIVSPTLFNIQGNNPENKNYKVYYNDGKYDIEHIIIEGGELTQEDEKDEIIFDGGVIE